MFAYTHPGARPPNLRCTVIISGVITTTWWRIYYCVPDNKMLGASLVLVVLLVVVALLLLCKPFCADPEGDIMKSSKDTSPRMRLNSVGESDTSNSPEDERKKGRKRRVRTQGKPKNPQKNAREKKRVEAVATAYRELRTALGAGDESRRRTTKVDTLQVAIQFIHDLTKELAGVQLPSNEPSDGIFPLATEPSHAVQANLVRICPCCCMLPRFLQLWDLPSGFLNQSFV